MVSLKGEREHAVPLPRSHQIACQLLDAVADDAVCVHLVSQLLPRLQPCRHSVDFACVRWHGESYSFTATQAAIVRVLWSAWEEGCPEIRQETLLDQVGSESRNLSDLFKGHPAWGKLIVGGGSKGAFRLADGEE